MPADACTTAVPSLRQRRRAAATQEIVEAAENYIAEHGPHALSLRGVARNLGMTVQGLYHYFPNRDALVTVLVTKAYRDLAEAVSAAADTAADEPAALRFMAAAEGYRRWAITHVERFQLLYGAPLRHYAAPHDGPTTQAMHRICEIFQREMFDGFTTAQLAAADTRGLHRLSRRIWNPCFHTARKPCPLQRALSSSAHGATCTAWSSWRCSDTPPSSANTRPRFFTWRCGTCSRTYIAESPRSSRGHRQRPELACQAAKFHATPAAFRPSRLRAEPGSSCVRGQSATRPAFDARPTR